MSATHSPSNWASFKDDETSPFPSAPALVERDALRPTPPPLGVKGPRRVGHRRVRKR